MSFIFFPIKDGFHPLATCYYCYLFMTRLVLHRFSAVELAKGSWTHPDCTRCRGLAHPFLYCGFFLPLPFHLRHSKLFPARLLLSLPEPKQDVFNKYRHLCPERMCLRLCVCVLHMSVHVGVYFHS